jgi:hypothetical protein
VLILLLVVFLLFLVVTERFVGNEPFPSTTIQFSFQLRDSRSQFVDRVVKFEAERMTLFQGLRKLAPSLSHRVASCQSVGAKRKPATQ